MKPKCATRKSLNRALWQLRPTLLLCLVLIIACGNQDNPPQFTLISAEDSGLDFENTLVEDEQFNIIQYLYFYNGGGVAIGDVNNDGFPDVYLSSNQGTNLLYLNRTDSTTDQILFEDITELAQVGGSGNWSTGVTMVDINADGWLDIYLCQIGGYKQFSGRNQLFINQGCSAPDQGCIPNFVEEAASYGLDHEGFSTQAAYLDYDLDGDLDLYLLCHSVHSTETYRDTSATRQRSAQAGDRLFRNQKNSAKPGEKYFVDVSEEAGIYGGIAGYGLGVGVGDFDKNGFPDIYVGNDFHENDFLYLNQGNGRFQEAASEALDHCSYFSMGNDVLDLNNDELLDIFTLDMKPSDEYLYKSAQGPDSYDIYRFKRSFGYHHQFPRNMLQMQATSSLGELRFSEIGQLLGIDATDWSWGPVIADYDLDGWKDIYVTNGIVRRPNDLDYLQFIADQEIQNQASDLALAEKMPSGEAINYLFQNQPGQGFIDVTETWNLALESLSNGAAAADLDLDGDLDLVVNNINAKVFLWQNQNPAQHNYLQIALIGPNENPFGLGAKITCFAGDAKQYQEFYTSRGWQSSTEYVIHFGLGHQTRVDSLLIKWPDGKTSRKINLIANQKISIDHSEAQETRSLSHPKKSVLYREHSLIHPPFIHREDPFFENTREPLMPIFYSNQGPALCTADLNGDGRLDFFIGGAKNQPSAIYIQDRENHWYHKPTPAIKVDSISEDVASLALDVDDDGDLDLLVGSAGNEYRVNAALKDRIYLNDGNANFTKSALPAYFSQTSVLTASTPGEDGSQNIFVGNQASALNYGKNPDSHLLIKRGQGSLNLADSQYIDLQNLGMVSDACWLDVDHNGRQDLIVVGHWMSPTVFKNNGTGFQKGVLKTDVGTDDLLGWWNCIESADLDQDGDPDLILGNFGLNSNLHPTLTQPVQLFISDFDQNFTSDPILTYFRNGRKYPLFGLQELGTQLVYLKKKFRSHRDFAKLDFYEIFSEQQIEAAQRQTATNFATLILWNEGNGTFRVGQLPEEAQHSAIFDIIVDDMNGDNQPDIFLAGNTDRIHPAIGNMNGSQGLVLYGQGDREFLPSTDVFDKFVNGQVRNLRMVREHEIKTFLIARNDQSLVAYRTR